MNQDLVLGLAILLAIAAATFIFVWYGKQKTIKLRKRFGPEYDRTLRTAGNQRLAEKELTEREKRVESFDIRPLTYEDRRRYGQAWKETQSRFVDQPSLALQEADELVQEALKAVGYPGGDFDQRVADISVHHPEMANHYRIAREIANRNKKGQANTEDLRQAFIAYKELFVDLLEGKTQKGRIVKEEFYEPRNKREYRS